MSWVGDICIFVLKGKQIKIIIFRMSSLTRLFSESSKQSTNSFDSLDMEGVKTHFDFAPKDIFYTDPEGGYELLILTAGDPLPVMETRYKRKLSWSYGLKFRFAC